MHRDVGGSERGGSWRSLPRAASSARVCARDAPRLQRLTAGSGGEVAPLAERCGRVRAGCLRGGSAGGSWVLGFIIACAPSARPGLLLPVLSVRWAMRVFWAQMSLVLPGGVGGQGRSGLHPRTRSRRRYNCCRDPRRLPSRPRAARPFAVPRRNSSRAGGGRGGRTVLRHSPRRAVMPRQARHVGASGGERRVLAGLQLRRDKCASSPFPALPLLSHLLLRFAPGLGSRLSLRPSLARSAETLTLKLRGLDPCPSAGLCDFGSPSSCCCALSLPNLWIWCGHVQVAAATWR